MSDRQCPSCGGFCKKSGCERENFDPDWATYRQGRNDERLEVIDILERLQERHQGLHNYYSYAVKVIKGEI